MNTTAQAGRSACEIGPRMRFGSRSLSVHLLRGAAGLGLLGLGLWGFVVVGWPALLLIPPAGLLLKGCPMCWTQGLFETLAWRAAARAAKAPPARN